MQFLCSWTSFQRLLNPNSMRLICQNQRFCITWLRLPWNNYVKLFSRRFYKIKRHSNTSLSVELCSSTFWIPSKRILNLSESKPSLVIVKMIHVFAYDTFRWLRLWFLSDPEQSRIFQTEFFKKYLWPVTFSIFEFFCKSFEQQILGSSNYNQNQNQIPLKDKARQATYTHVTDKLVREAVLEHREFEARRLGRMSGNGLGVRGGGEKVCATKCGCRYKANSRNLETFHTEVEGWINMDTERQQGSSKAYFLFKWLFFADTLKCALWCRGKRTGTCENERRRR